MGTFGGHALPGSFFIMFSLWWTISIFQRYYHARFRGGQGYTSTITFPCRFLCQRLQNWEVEGFIKILFTSIGLTIEIITGFANGKFTYLGNAQHATMFFFFGMSGVVDLMVHHKVLLPKGIEYVAMVLALVVEGVLFNFHLGGREELDTKIHIMLLYAIYAGALATAIEMFYRQNVLAALSRAYLMLLQGTWFWHVGFILYNPLPNPSLWEQHNHMHIVLAAAMFAWHIGVDFIIILAIGIVIGQYHRRHGNQDAMAYSSLNMQLMKKESNGQTTVHVCVNEESESDVEFERSPMQR